MKSIQFFLILFFAFVMAGCGGQSALHAVAKVVDYSVSKSQGLEAQGVTANDLDDLEAGRLFVVIKRYEAQPLAELTLQQNRILCDLQVSVSHLEQGHRCYEALYQRLADSVGEIASGEYEAIAARIALLHLQMGEYANAKFVTEEFTSPGGRYVQALALAALDRGNEAEEIAQTFAKAYFDPKQSFFAANIYLAMGEYEKARAILMSPRTRLVRDYGLMPSQGTLGQHITPASFRLDLFDEYRFGVMDSFSYAPPANVYVEFAAAKSLLESGERDEARTRLEFLVTSELAAAYREVRWMAHYELAKMLQSEGRRGDAIEHFEMALDIIEGIRSSIATEAGRIGFSQDKNQLYEELMALYIEENLLEKAIETVERAKGRALVELLNRHDSLMPMVASHGEGQILYERMALEEHELTVRSALQPEGAAAKLHEYSLARLELIRRTPHLASLITVLPVEYAQLLQQLGSDETGILFQRFGSQLYIFLFDDQGVEYAILPADQIEMQVTMFRRSVQNFSSNNYLEISNRLFDTLIGRFGSERLKRHLVIAPSGILFYLPFGALHDGEHYLAEHHTLNIVPSFQVRTMIEQGEPQLRNALLLGNPDRNNPSQDLPGAEREVQTIARVMQNTHMLIRKEATKEALFQMAEDFDVLHIAGHGTFSADEPLQSRLLLAPSEGSSGDVTVEDLYGLRTDAELVVLSACETALGQVAQGDELVGMIRGFLYAGAKGVVGSLWEVEDNSTALLMQHFYLRMNQGLRPVDALHEAQKIIRTRHRYTHPYFWSSFRYTGKS